MSRQASGLTLSVLSGSKLRKFALDPRFLAYRRDDNRFTLGNQSAAECDQFFGLSHDFVASCGSHSSASFDGTACSRPLSWRWKKAHSTSVSIAERPGSQMDAGLQRFTCEHDGKLRGAA